MIAQGVQPKRGIPGLSKTQIPVIATTVVLMLMVAFGALKYEHFFEFSNFEGIVKGNAYLGIVAVGMTFVIIAGGIDLSVGAVVGTVGVVLATLMAKGMSLQIAVPLVLLIGIVFGASMGFLIAKFEIAPFLVTLAGMFLARGVGLVINQDSIEISNKLVDRINDFYYGETVALIVVLIAGAALLHLTPFGRSVFAIGCNESSSKLMGLPVYRTKVSIYAISGFCSALAGVVYALSMSSAMAKVCDGLELDAIAAVVIGGTLLTGGIGTIVGTLMGFLTLGIIGSITNFANIDSWWSKIMVGGLLCAFILLQKVVSVRQTNTG